MKLRWNASEWFEQARIAKVYEQFRNKLQERIIFINAHGSEEKRAVAGSSYVRPIRYFSTDNDGILNSW